MAEEKLLDITEAEWQVMRVIWAQGQTSSQDIQNILNDQMNWKPATTKTLISRLKNKNLLQAKRQGRAYIYSPAVAEEACTQSKIKHVFDKICQQKRGHYIKELIEDTEISQADIEDLEKLLAKKKEQAPKLVACNCIPGQCRCVSCHHKEED